MRYISFYFALIACLCSIAFGLFFPGIQPAGYTPGQVLGIRVSSLTSTRAVLPFPFYSIKHCKPSSSRLKAEKKHENIGEIMIGYKDEPSEYFVEVLRNITCRKVCDTITYSSEEMNLLKKRIDDQYRGNMALDGLSVAQETRRATTGPKVMVGYPLGVPARIGPNGQSLVNNHLHFTILFNEPDVHNENNEETFRIVGFHVNAYSIEYNDVNVECDMTKPFVPSSHRYLSAHSTSEISYTYSVTWVPEPNIAWATRWDIYLKGSEADRRIHWFSLLNACTISVCLTLLIAMIMLHALRRDLARYNEPVSPEEAQEESGWKLIHGDVFRAPANATLLSILVASGLQLLLMSAATLLIAICGFLNPQNRGALVTVLIMCFVLASFFSGLVGSVLLKFFKEQSWRNVFYIAGFLPGCSFSAYVVLNFFHWAKHASSAVPFLTLVALLAMWLCCTVPLTLVGASIGYRMPVLQVPTRVNVIPRMVPAPKNAFQRVGTVLTGGLFPFGVAFVELLYIISSLWQGGVYYIFGFLTAVFFIVIICAAESAITVTYYNLCNEDHYWWWKSFLVGCCTGMYIFLYSFYYLYVALPIRQPTSIILYLGYMLMASTYIGLMLSSICVLSTLWFVRKIYAAIKID